MTGRLGRAAIGIGAAMLLAGTANAGAASQQKPRGDQPPSASSASSEIDRMLAGLSQVSGPELERRIAAAAAHPLGSRENPVRAAMPEGQRAYLGRLRCSDGAAPAFRRIGNFGPGVYGNIIDGYQVDCRAGTPREAVVFMDMYHPEHVEDRSVAGFTLVPQG